MMSHTIFIIVACSVLLLWAVALVGYILQMTNKLRFPLGTIALALGWAIMIGYMAWLWSVLDRPPMRTMGETRLWYTLFLPAITLIIEWRWRTRLVAIPTVIMGMVFLLITALHPETLDKSLMPALNSPWFAPHVIVYMVSYATLGVAAVVAVWTLIRGKAVDNEKAVDEVRRLIYVGFPLMTLGMILGAFWAKIAWGTYWGWDPKETFAFLSWTAYLIYVHLDRYAKMPPRRNLVLATGTFVVVLACWFAVNYLPSASMSVHTYTQ
ncbi:MAG: cytochrome c biogenesis protein [Armatimonadota bacterium]